MGRYDEPGQWDGWLARPVEPDLEAYLTELAGVRRLPAGEEGRLRKLAADGYNEAGQRLAEANLQFVVYLMRKYAGRAPNLIELLQAGNVGLVRALQDRGALASDVPLRDLLEREIRASMDQHAAGDRCLPANQIGSAPSMWVGKPTAMNIR